jgi:hypothetical protein
MGVLAAAGQLPFLLFSLPAGGALGGAVGLRPALAVCAVGALLSPLPALFSPLRRLREQPAPEDQLASETS